MDILDISNLSDSFDKEGFIDSCVNDGNLEIEFYYLSHFKSTKILRDFICIICKKFNISSKDTWRFILITDEMNNNAIEYWSSSWEENIIRIIVKNYNNKLFFVIEVEDTWTWKKHKTAKEMEKIRNDRLQNWFKWHKSIRWRWLFMIITNIVNKLYFKDIKNWWLLVGIEKEVVID